MKKVLLTGAFGFIGSYLIVKLQEAGYEVYAVSRSKTFYPGVNVVTLDLSNKDEVNARVKEIAPEICINLAWYLGADCLTTEKNNLFLDLSKNLLNSFIENGGKLFVGAGTCLEYEFKQTALMETDPVLPLSAYAKAKDEFRKYAEDICRQANIDFAWARIFYAYGNNENPRRLLPYIIKNCQKNTPVIVKNPSLIRDYLYAKDIAGALLKITDISFNGTVNISSLNPISVGDFVLAVAGKMGKQNLVHFQNNVSDEPAIMLGDNHRLIKDVGYNIKYNLEQALGEIIND